MIAAVVPTIRKQTFNQFKEAWDKQFKDYFVELVTVYDGDSPYVEHKNSKYSVKDIMGKYSDVIYNLNDGVRNLGFAYVARFLPEALAVISLDDDVTPFRDSILDHINALNMDVPISWITTASEYMRGFPYSKRNEAHVVLSHGVWRGVADWDAPTQLTKGNQKVAFYKGVVPKGSLFPICAMNMSFKRVLLPYIYQAPMGKKVGIHRFADIWGGIEAKKDIDDKGWAAVTGYSVVTHDRASNVYDNLIKESLGLKMNEQYGQGAYFNIFYSKRKRWQEYIRQYVKET